MQENNIVVVVVVGRIRCETRARYNRGRRNAHLCRFRAQKLESSKRSGRGARTIRRVTTVRS